MFSSHFNDALSALAKTAAQRDRQGGHAAKEKALLRDAGLLRLAIPAKHGGDERSWPDIYRHVRALANVDSALAHVLAFHQLQVATVLIYGTSQQQCTWLRRTVDESGWWGNALNPRDARLQATPSPSQLSQDGYVLNGPKGFCSGTRGSHYLTVSARVNNHVQPVLGLLETAAPGISVKDDWNPMGQRQTDSGSVQFTQVKLPLSAVMRSEHAETTAFHTLRNCLAQLVLVNLFVGVAQGARNQARDYAIAHVKPWQGSGIENATDDPYLLRRMGEMQAQISGAALMADHAASLLQNAWQQGESLTAAGRAEVAVAVFEAKVMAHRCTLFATQEMFDVVGSRGTHADLGFDRFWRNVRTHTLHDPLDYKLQTLGRWAVHGEEPSAHNYN
ncbi:acyl-CoA dehydrogenase family protein [Comamonas sp. Y33R10-2]|uniref:acyl-CoA dehydrogenase family protein n=1 Tax=Comamonas sp. Y33R10-2 TaxID=2853257 RepID=UPI001C5CA68F|nr:acyl-CoA dehydrogenase family protein [Comamonas sp. Y33R10-2]QXZ08590.1 acyl-CoA dehydrogenase family protein [Comamonas sp. Y33R10-2]